MNAWHRWCAVIGKPGCARPEGTPAMDLESKAYAHTCRQTT